MVKHNWKQLIAYLDWLLFWTGGGDGGEVRELAQGSFGISLRKP